MMRLFLKFLYKRYTRLFQDFLVEDLIEGVPTEIREPAIGFLAKGKQQLTKYLLFQAYFLQRKSVAEVDNIERYHGMLIMVKFFLSLVADAPVREDEGAMPLGVPTERKDPTLPATEFLHGFEERRKAIADKGS